MSGHTPGPWGLTQEPERGLRDEVAVCYGAAGGGATYVVAERSALHSPDFRAMREANARLIAAAPELLEALIDARKQLEAYEEALNGEDYNSPRINEAIAKATGAQS